jgi:type IV secretory pathway VirJ component
MGRPLLLATLTALAIALAGAGTPALAQIEDTLILRGHSQTLHLYGTRGTGTPVIVSSGDGGWIHLGPHIAKLLAANGYFVVGFDAKSYLESFTSSAGTLRPEDEPGDYRALIAYAQKGSTAKPILMGVSEGAGLSVLAAADPQIKRTVAGVIGLGLPDINELGWRWSDSMIYVTHGVPKEPTFSAASLLGRLAPVPVADIHSTRDEFVPVAEAERTLQHACAPKRLWVVNASNHRFSDNLTELNQRVLDAIAWVHQNQP